MPNLLLCPPLTMTPAASDHHYPAWGHEGDTGHTRCPSVSSPHLTSHNNTHNDRELVSQLRRIRRIFHPFKFSPARPHYFCGWILSEMWGPPVTSQHLMTAVTRGIIVPRPEYFHFAVRREDEIWVNTEQSVMLWCSSSSGVITVHWPGVSGLVSLVRYCQTREAIVFKEVHGLPLIKTFLSGIWSEDLIWLILAA